MQVAVISDVHSNLPALQAVLAALEREPVDELWCLGDLVGYGSDPDSCTDLVARNADVCLAGNHDLVVAGEIPIDAFASSAAVAARWTADAISSDTLDFLSRLKPVGERAGYGLFHASPRDPIWEYVLSFDQAQAVLEVQPFPVCLIGHSHVACYFEQRGSDAIGDQAPANSVLDTVDRRCLVNPGSVGQPRDGDPRAAYLVLDTTSGQVEYRRVEYDIESAATAIVKAGLPRQLAERLYLGQ